MIKNKIEKVIITGQALRNNQITILWMYRLFSYFLEAVTDLKCYCAIPENKTSNIYKNKDYVFFDIKKIYNAYGISYSYSKPFSNINKKWAKIYYKNKYNKEAFDYLYSFFKNSLVVSFEVEDIVSTALSYFDIPHIDINLCPIRFLEDLMLCFKTKNKKIYDKILKYRVPEEFLYMQASRLKAYYGYETFMPDSNDVLFLGQTDCDKTLIDVNKNKLYSILNHKKDFKKAVLGFDNILYKPHPFANQNNETKVLGFLNTLSNVKIIDTNFYQIMSMDNVKKVVSVSSGACSEARYFGKEVQTLLHEGVPRQTEDKFDENKYVSIYGDFFSLNFWSDILSPIIKTKKYDNLISVAGKNSLRNTKPSNIMYYSYENFDNNKIANDLNIMRDNIHTLWNSTNLDKNNFHNKMQQTISALKLHENDIL